MNEERPPKGPINSFSSHHTANPTTSDCTGARRRRDAARRLPPLSTGRADPWRYEPPTAGYEDAAAYLLAAGLTPAPDIDGLRAMWRRGSHHRRDAARIAQAWEVAQ